MRKNGNGDATLEPVTAPVCLLAENMRKPKLFTFAGYDIAAFSARAPGFDRDNQDSAGLIPFDERSGVLVVADGVGGAVGGGEASRLAVRAMRSALSRASAAGVPLRSAILDGFETANERVAALGTGAATTMIVVECHDGTARTYHVGDAEAILVGQRGRVKLQTVSHTPPALGLEAGLLTAEQAIEHEERHLVLNLIGSRDMRIEIGSRVALARRDTLVVGSDGLFDNWSPDALLDLVRLGPLADAADALATRTVERMGDADAAPSKPDDLTFLIARRGTPVPVVRRAATA